jgi:hypothetical protein
MQKNCAIMQIKHFSVDFFSDWRSKELKGLSAVLVSRRWWGIPEGA